jgi:ribosomal protein L11 methyltransferase
MNSQEYIEVKLYLEPYSVESAEIIIAELGELPFESFEEDSPYVKCYIQKENFDQQALKVVLSGLQGMGFKASYTYELIPSQNWNEVWESNFEPIVVDNICTIKAPFHKNLKKTRYNVTIMPQMAFGTGHHQTTYLMCRALLEMGSELKDKVVMDIGCGTAVLGIIAAKLGAKKVTGIDIDAVAAISARDNVKLNRLSKKIDVHYGDASRLQRNSYDLVLANINRNILLADMPRFASCLSPGGELLLSGFYTEDVPVLLAEAEKHDLHSILQRQDANWSLLLLKKGKSS